jgi:hypothetical protein
MSVLSHLLVKTFLHSQDPEGEADQDRCEGGEPRSLRRISDGRGRHPTADVPRDFAADCGTTAAATTSASVRRSIVMRSQAIDGRSAPKCQGIARSAPRPPFGLPDALVAVLTSRLSCRKAGKARYSHQIGSHLGNPWVKWGQRCRAQHITRFSLSVAAVPGSPSLQ